MVFFPSSDEKSCGNNNCAYFIYLQSQFNLMTERILPVGGRLMWLGNSVRRIGLAECGALQSWLGFVCYTREYDLAGSEVDIQVASMRGLALNYPA